MWRFLKRKKRFAYTTKHKQIPKQQQRFSTDRFIIPNTRASCKIIL
uniref:Uncharacterized protein n=1 Tax=Myoviridae sp. ctdxI18 TaxID=2826673 RepID=A0A8S5M3G5_9CAUD|nr:MAG TPA: hypothetical protein [Myoviridae sp. ctdxI18]DAP44894.1 MAG TPA: hypothetical protein [Caudoviricetes sp.]